MNRSKKVFIMLLTAVALFFLQGMAYADDSNSGERIEIDCFFINVCSSCDPMSDFYEYFSDELDIDLSSAGLKVIAHNVYEEKELELWRQLAKEKNYDEDAYPAFVLNGRIYSLGNSVEDKTDEIINTLESNELVFAPDTSKIVYFSSPGCKYCDDIKKEIIDKIPLEIALENGNTSTVKIIEYSISKIEDVQIFKAYCAGFSIDEQMQETPFIIVGLEYFDYKTANLEKLINMLESGNGVQTPIITLDQSRAVAESTEKGQENVGDKSASEVDNMSLLGVFGIGLINGLNPCSISMFLMLLSLMAMEFKKILKIGLSFAFGKFIGFFLLGTLLYSVIDSINFSGIRIITGIILAVFSAAMIFLNILDYFAAKNERYGDIKLQLPQKLRASNHKLLKNIFSDGTGIIIGSGVGLLFSGGEFLCTGQIYLATIVNTIHSGANFTIALLYLAVYSLAFVIPLIVLVILAASGKRVLQMSEFFRKKMPVVKLLNAAIFAIILALTLIFIL